MLCWVQNVHNDPEAAKIVFGAFPEIYMAGLNVTRQLDLLKVRERVKDFGKIGQFIFDSTQHYIDILTK